jgi:16S rRNA (adenine1518-N6/adenine1519-N6)-dimethyltransferase
MNLFSAQEIKIICEELGIVPTKSKGQNFLIDKNILNKILSAADLKSSDTVLEVGPGFGALTDELLRRVQKVFAVELDKKLFERLEMIYKHQENLKIINEDVLEVEIDSLLSSSGPRSKARGSKHADVDYPVKPGNDGGAVKYKVVANLPYQITSAVIRKFLENKLKPELLILMVQKEVAERICAKPGDMGLLSVSVQFYGKPEIAAKVSKNCFWPVPTVDSAVLKITPIKCEKIDEEKFFRIVRVGFAHPRKQLRRNLADGLHLPVEQIDRALLSANLNPKIRAEELGVDEWIKIAKLL